MTRPMTTAVCQRCRREETHWQITQAEFNVGSMKYWKVQLCRYCTSQVALIVLGALREVSEDAPLTGDR